MDIEEIKEAFLEESAEYLNILKDNLNNMLDNFPEIDHNVIYETYRAAHSIKGTAGFLALGNISAVAKAIETKMMPFRDKEKSITVEEIELIKKASQFLGTLIDEMESSEETDISEVLQILA